PDGNPAQGLGEQPGGRGHLVVGDLHAEQFTELVQTQACGHDVAAVGHLTHVVLAGVVFIGELTHEFFEDVLDGDQAGHTAVLVHDGGDVHVAGAHFVQEVIDHLRLRHEQSRAHELVHGGGALAALAHHVRQGVLEVEDPGQFVHRLPHHGNAGEPGPHEQAHGFDHGFAGGDGDHIG